MAAADLRFLLEKLRHMRDFGRLLGIEAKLEELDAAVRSAAERANRSPLFPELRILYQRTNKLLDQIWCWCERHGATSSISGTRTGEDLIKAITPFIIKFRFRPSIVSELKNVVDEYQARRRLSDSHEEDQINLFTGRATDPKLTNEEVLIGRNKDVDNILAVMHSRSRDIWDENRRRVIRRRLFESRNNDDKRELKDLVTRRWRSTILEDPKEWRFLNIIPIVGTVGIGKTAVARMVFHHAADWFNERVWVYVSPLFDRKRVLREFAHRHQQQQESAAAAEQPLSPGVANEDDVMNSLMSRMSGKRFLLVLDDFWNEDQKEWDELIKRLLKVAAASGMIGNVVIVTTRSRVAAEMNTDCYELQALSTDDSRRLLSRSLPTFPEHGQGHDDEQLGNVRKTLLERCSGLPQAIKTLAERMKEVDLDPNFRFMSTNNPELLESFRLSYNLLFPEHWKEFLQFCSLFPENHIYDMEEFSDIWSAENLPLSPDKGFATEFHNLWKECFKKLESSSSSGKVTYKLCPLIRDLSLHLGGLTKMDMSQLSIQLINPGTSKFPCPDNLPKALTALILSREAQMALSGQRCEISVIPEDWLVKHSHLRVLDLQCTMIEKLPRAIGKLFDLRYLNLSETDIRYLPRSIGELRSLRFLKLKNCKRLRKLNDAVTNLVELQKLDLSGCWFLVEVPESMKNMKKLKCLNIKNCPLIDRTPRIV